MLKSWFKCWKKCINKYVDFMDFCMNEINKRGHYKSVAAVQHIHEPHLSSQLKQGHFHLPY
jgi:hypothetical protein